LDEEKGHRQPFDSPVELHLAFYFQQGFYGGWDYGLGTQAEGWRAKRAYRRDRLEIGKAKPRQ
jgi:hypothetical protein